MGVATVGYVDSSLLQQFQFDSFQHDNKVSVHG